MMIFSVFSGTLGAAGKTASDKNVYVFASEAAYPPMEFIDENGRLAGFDIDLIQALAQEEGFEYEIRNTAWDGIFAGLANGAYDGIISAVTILEERRAVMDFSDPYLEAGQILVVPWEGPDQGVLSDFQGQKVGTQQGTTSDFEVEKFPRIQRKAYDEIGLAIEDLVNGNLAAVVCDTTTAYNFVGRNPNYKNKLKIIGEPFTEELYGIAVHKDRKELLEMINAGLKALTASGTMAELREKWLY